MRDAPGLVACRRRILVAGAHVVLRRAKQRTNLRRGVARLWCSVQPATRMRTDEIIDEDPNKRDL
jgi:hypothetical protein